MENIEQFIENEYQKHNREIMYVPTSQTYTDLCNELSSLNTNSQYIVFDNLITHPEFKRAIYEFYNFQTTNYEFLFECSNVLKLYALKRVNNG